MKKKVWAILMAASMTAAALTGCGSGENTAQSSESSEGSNEAQSSGESTTGGQTASSGETTSDKVYRIGICQLLEHDALGAATQGFQDALTELLGEGNVTFDYQNAQGEQANCATICTQFVADDVDLILANATASLQAATAATNSIPILGTSITDYATALDASDWSGASGTNVSGTSDLAPIEEQENMLVELFPDAKKVGILYCSAEANSSYQAQVFEASLEEDGLSYEEYTVADSSEIQAVVTGACQNCDVLYIPTDNTLANNTEAINNICLPAGIPVIAGEEGICAGCGVATLSISYYDIGYKAGEMAYDILVNGADISTMNIEFAPQVTKKYNKEICEKLNVTIPDGYTAIGE